MNFQEKAIISYRFLFSNIFKENKPGKNFIKNFIYSIALFFAKRKGKILFFFTEKEKDFENKTEKQYKVFLKNFIGEKKSVKKRYKIDLVLNYNESEERYFKDLEIYKDFQLYIIIIQEKINRVKKILENTKLNYEIIEKIDDDELPSIFNNIINKTESDYVIFLKDGIIYQNALQHIGKKISEDNPDIIYSDEDTIDERSNRTNPMFKPQWSPQLLLSFNYIGSFIVFSIPFLKSLNGFTKTKSFEYEILLRASKKAEKIIHIPKILFGKFDNFKKDNQEDDKICLQKFLKENDIKAKVTNNQDYFSIKQELDTNPLISIIIPTKNNKKLLKKCLKSIQNSTYKNYEIIIVNNGKKIEPQKDCKIIEYSDSFNFSKMNNFAVKHASGDYILFLNDDTEIINKDWLEYLMFYSMQKDVGVVGSLLLFPKSGFYPDSIQHAGVTLGTAGPAIHSFSYSHYNTQKNQNFDKVARNTSAVTAACMMVRRDVFDKVNGFDEKFAVSFGDTDICLRIKQEKYQIVYCPSSKLYHAESSTRRSKYPLADEIKFLNRWEDYIISGDEFYNPNLTHINRNFRIAPHPSDTPAISLLMEIFYFREDLQRLIPDYDTNINDAVNWAATKGVTTDIARTALVPYNKFFLNNSSENIKELADAIYKFNHSVKLQEKFSEVFSGKYDNLLTYTKSEKL